MLGWLFRPAIPGRARPLILLAALLALAWPAPGHAQAGRASTYYFLVYEVKLADGIPAEVGTLVRERLTGAIEAHARLVGALPEGAPDPQKAPKAFESYVKKRKITPYRVNVEILRYRHEVEPNPRGSGQHLTVSVDLRIFGETMPVRVMAFTGEGSATVKVEIGKRLRARDSEVTQREALDQAVADALRTSIQRLDEKLGQGSGKAGRGKKK